MKRRFFFLKAFVADFSGLIHWRISIRDHDSPSHVELIILIVCLYPSLISSPKDLIAADGLPSAVAVCITLFVWFAIPFQLRFGWKQLLGRMLMATSGTLAILDVMYGPFYDFAYLSRGILQIVFMFCMYAYTTMEIMKEQMRVTTDRTKAFIEQNQVDAQFFILDVLQAPFKAGAVAGIASNIEQFGVLVPMIAWISVRHATDPMQLVIEFEKHKADFFIAGISFTGFEFLICDFSNSEDNSEEVEQDLQRKLLAFKPHCQTLHIEPVSLKIFQLTDASAYRDVSDDANFADQLRVYIRVTWTQEISVLAKKLGAITSYSPKTK